MQIKLNNFLKSLIICAVCFIVLLGVIKYPGLLLTPKTSNTDQDTQSILDISAFAQSNPAKAERWKAMEQEVAGWGDALGLPIDPGIKNTVIVLNLLGFKTSGSCEGHMDWGKAYPWIEFDIDDKKIDALKNLINDFYKNHSVDKERMVTIAKINSGLVIMWNPEGAWQVRRNEKEKKEKLKEYQEEMKSFTEFLTRYYFEK